MIVVMLRGNTLPAGMPDDVMFTLPELSMAAAVPSVAWLTTAVQLAAPTPVDTFTSEGTFVKDGGVVSISVMVCDALTLFPAASVAVYVRVRISGSAADPR